MTNLNVSLQKFRAMNVHLNIELLVCLFVDSTVYQHYFGY